jgi:hypothetical protein
MSRPIFVCSRPGGIDAIGARAGPWYCGTEVRVADPVGAILNRQNIPNATWGLPGKPHNGGDSNPRFYAFDDGTEKLVKWHPSRHGPKACYNELVASRLGQLIQAPLLRGTVVYVPDDIIPEEHLTNGATAGFHFAVTRMPGSNFDPQRHYSDISNKGQLPAAGVQLAWLHVGDQRRRNQYLAEAKDEHGVSLKLFRLVDMAAMFATSKWTIDSLESLPMEYKLPEHLAEQLTMRQLEPVIKMLKAQPGAEIAACFFDYPEEWGISDEERQAATARVLNARDQIEEIIRTGNPTVK